MSFKCRIGATILIIIIILTCIGAWLFLKEGEPTSISSQDIISQKKIPQDKIPVTVLVKYAFSINEFEKALEEKFPQLDLIQVGNYTHDMGVDEYSSRLEHDDLTDIIMTWPLDVGKEYWAERLLDLSGMDFTSKYNLSMLNSIAQNGSLYYLPGPAQVRGIVYNKTLFEENGWKIPTNFDEFIELCKTIEATGIRSIQLGFKNPEVLDTAFIGYNYNNFFSSPQDSQWLDSYNIGIGSFVEYFDSALDTFVYMRDQGIWQANDLNIGYADREYMFFNRQCAMIEDSLLMARMGSSLTGTTDEFALMPFLNHGSDGDWVRLYMVCYIGLNKDLASPENKVKYELIMQIMDYISTPEGQQMLAADTGAMFSSLIGTLPPRMPEIQNLLNSLEQGRYAIFPKFKNAQEALRIGLAGLLKNELTKAEVIKLVDQQNRKPIPAPKPTILGKASSDFTLVETGNFITDAMRKRAGTEIALFMDNGKDGKYNGKGVSGRIYNGDVTDHDIYRILPDTKQGETGTLWKVSVSGENLIKILEYSMPINNGNTGWFYYFSGLTMEYDVTAEPGSRIKSIVTTDGKHIEPTKNYFIAIMDQSVPQEFILANEQTNVPISDILFETIRKSGTISPPKDDRFKF